jgi:hypothetical protein
MTAVRLALLVEWGNRCAWCTRPLAFMDAEVDHIVPRSLGPAEAATMAQRLGLGSSPDPDRFENLVPSCGRCNRRKGGRPPDDAPAMLLFAQEARSRVAGVERRVRTMATERAVGRAHGTLAAAAEALLGDGPHRERLLHHLDAALDLLEAAAEGRDHITVNVSPDLVLAYAHGVRLAASLRIDHTVEPSTASVLVAASNTRGRAIEMEVTVASQRIVFDATGSHEVELRWVEPASIRSSAGGIEHLLEGVVGVDGPPVCEVVVTATARNPRDGQAAGLARLHLVHR